MTLKPSIVGVIHPSATAWASAAAPLFRLFHVELVSHDAVIRASDIADQMGSGDMKPLSVRLAGWVGYFSATGDYRLLISQFIGSVEYFNNCDNW